jgi:hypothetical protein
MLKCKNIVGYLHMMVQSISIFLRLIVRLRNLWLVTKLDQAIKQDSSALTYNASVDSEQSIQSPRTAIGFLVENASLQKFYKQGTLFTGSLAANE